LATLAILYLSLAPAQDMIPRPGYPRPVEHFAAYCAWALILGFSLPRQSPWRVGLAMVAFAATVEMLQHFSPGRTPSPFDFAGSALGAAAGLLVWRFVAPRLLR
jgi:VanZ family protein